MAILDTFAIHGIIKKESIPDLSKRINEGALMDDVLARAGV